MLDRINPLDNPYVPVEHILVVVVFRLYHLVSHLEPPAEPLDAGLAGTNWV
jgi:hypothetical protein